MIKTVSFPVLRPSISQSSYTLPLLMVPLLCTHDGNFGFAEYHRFFVSLRVYCMHV